MFIFVYSILPHVFTRDNTIRQLSVVNSSLTRSRTSCPPLFSMLHTLYFKDLHKIYNVSIIFLASCVEKYPICVEVINIYYSYKIQFFLLSRVVRIHLELYVTENIGFITKFYFIFLRLLLGCFIS